jgi:hypothetical protein
VGAPGSHNTCVNSLEYAVAFRFESGLVRPRAAKILIELFLPRGAQVRFLNGHYGALQGVDALTDRPWVAQQGSPTEDAPTKIGQLL